jgi:hypothetical protein
MKHFLFAVLAITLLVPALPMAHPGHDTKFVGTVSAVDKAKVEIKTMEGKPMTFKITPTTTFRRGTDKGAQTELKAGMRVAVTIVDTPQPYTAKDIQYSAAATTAAKK